MKQIAFLRQADKALVITKGWLTSITLADGLEIEAISVKENGYWILYDIMTGFKLGNSVCRKRELSIERFENWAIKSGIDSNKYTDAILVILRPRVFYA